MNASPTRKMNGIIQTFLGEAVAIYQMYNTNTRNKEIVVELRDRNFFRWRTIRFHQGEWELDDVKVF